MNNNAWRAELLDRSPLRIEPGQKVVLTFNNEGEKWERAGYKPAVVFEVKLEGQISLQRFFVRSKELLRQIYNLGEKIAGIKVELSREGSGLETRYSLKKID